MFIRCWDRNLFANDSCCSRSVGQKKFSASSEFDRSRFHRGRRRGRGVTTVGTSVTRANKNHARVNQSPVVCILRSIGRKARGQRPSRSPRCPSGLESGPGGRWQQNLSEFLPGTGPCQCKWLVRAKMEQDTARQGDSFLSRRTLASICYTSLVWNTTTAMMHGGDIGPDQNICYIRQVVPRSCVYRCGVLRYRWDQGPSDHAISGWTVGRCFKYWICIIEMRPSRYYICSSGRVLSRISRMSIQLTGNVLLACHSSIPMRCTLRAICFMLQLKVTHVWHCKLTKSNLEWVACN